MKCVRFLTMAGVILWAPGVSAESYAAPEGAPVPPPEVSTPTVDAPAAAEPSVEVHGQYRIRFLANGGRNLTTGGLVESTAHRARIAVTAGVTDKLKVQMSVQDVRHWGEELSTVSDFSADGFDVHEAWMQYADAGVTIRGGRQVINLDGQRLVGGLDWADQARTFDGVRVMYDKSDVHVEGFWTKLREEDAASQTASGDSDFGGFYARYDGSKMVKPSFYALYERDSAADKNRFTVGTHVVAKPAKGLVLNGEFYYQLGSIGPDGASADYSAMLAAVRAQYTVDATWKPTVAGWFEYISGDDDAADDTIKSFDTLFGTNHKFYGFMDFFLNIPVNTGNLGLVDIGGRAKITPDKKLSAFVDFHHFRFAQETATAGATAGNEVDLIVNYKVDKRLKLQGGVSVFLPDEAITCARLGACNPDPDVEGFGYLMANLTF